MTVYFNFNVQNVLKTDRQCKMPIKLKLKSEMK